MKPSPFDPPLDAYDGGLAAMESEASGLAALVQQHEAFEREITRMEAILAQGVDGGGSGLYEQLLRCRRISRKLDNRIQVARLQQALRTGS